VTAEPAASPVLDQEAGAGGEEVLAVAGVGQSGAWAHRSGGRPTSPRPSSPSPKTPPPRWAPRRMPIPQWDHRRPLHVPTGHGAANGWRRVRRGRGASRMASASSSVPRFGSAWTLPFLGSGVCALQGEISTRHSPGATKGSSRTPTFSPEATSATPRMRYSHPLLAHWRPAAKLAPSPSNQGGHRPQ